MLLVLFCYVKTSTIDFVHFSDIKTAENVATTTSLKIQVHFNCIFDKNITIP
jgi:hypothetical protein